MHSRNKDFWYYIAGAGLLAAVAGRKIYVEIKNRQDFKREMLKITPVILAEYGIQPNIMVTQAAHESGWGQSQLTKLANNLFGFAAEGSWQNSKKPVVLMPTAEYIGGKKVTVKRPFRKYNSWLDSCRDWARLISTRTGYALAYVSAKAGNLPEYAVKVAAGGYATDPKYAAKLITVGKEVDSINV